MRRARIALAACLGAAAAALSLLITTPPGPGLDPDAMEYLGAAESLVGHGALRVPAAEWDDPDSTSSLRHFPPGYSIVVAPGVAAGLSSVQSARLVQALAAGTMLALAFWLVSGVAGLAGGALAAVLLAVTPAMASDHVRILSEPLFLALLLATVLLMVRLPQRALACGLLAAAAGLVRYAGFSLSGAGALMALWRGGPPWRGRVRAAALVALPGIVAQGAWSLRARLEGGSIRSIADYGGISETLQEGWGTLLRWLAPGVHSPARVVVAAAVALLAIALAARAARGAPAFFGALGVTGASFAALVLISRLFADPDIPFDERMLSPLMVLASLAVAAAVVLVLRGLPRPARVASAIVVAAWVTASGAATLRFVHEAREGGWGYAMPGWQASRVVRWLRTEGRSHTLFTNNAAGIWFFTQRASRGLPESTDSSDVAGFGQALRSRRGVIAAFKDGYGTDVSADRVARLLHLRPLVHTAAGTVFGP